MVDDLAVIGGGTMGIGIAYVSAVAGIATLVVEPSPERSEIMMREFSAALESGLRRGKLSHDDTRQAHERLTVLQRIEEIPAGIDVIIESVPERAEVKKSVLQAAAEREPTLLASNTSSMSIDTLSTFVRDPSAFLGLHFFNPVWSIGLVEVVLGSHTAEPFLRQALDFVNQIGKESAVVADAPGFATSRLDLVAALEAMRMVEANVAAAEDIDRAVRLAYRHPVGPLMLSDIVGLDVRLDIAEQLEISLGERFRPPQILRDLVAAGHLGKKTGRGFLVWD